MRHHIRRALSIYRSDGVAELMQSAARYAPIELNNVLFRLRNDSCTLVMAEDWDTLVLLDACRYDMFEERIDIEGDLQSRVSAGSTSEEFLERNFGDGTYHDTVYVNTNPYLSKLGLDEGTFHAVVDLLDEWDDELETVRPETVTSAALDAHDRYPNKRLIIHFMQPHIPFIGEMGREITAKGWDRNVAGLAGKTVWQQLRDGGDIDASRVWDAYCENLDLVLSQVRVLLEELDGKSVISSDHGNMVGERLTPIPSRKKYGHFYGVYTSELVRVPWHMIDADERRTITTDPPVDGQTRTDDVVERRLDALGYR